MRFIDMFLLGLCIICLGIALDQGAHNTELTKQLAIQQTPSAEKCDNLANYWKERLEVCHESNRANYEKEKEETEKIITRERELQPIVQAMERGRKICTKHDYQNRWYADCHPEVLDKDGNIAGYDWNSSAKTFPCEIETEICTGKWVERK